MRNHDSRFVPDHLISLLAVLALAFGWFATPLVAQDGDAADTAATADESAPPDVEEALDAAESGPLAGHSNHGETFNEGPRQAAYLMGTTGNVHMDITTEYPEVQQFFDQGLGQLHGFWFFEAERSFRHAASMDPNCAMLYWGMAMANSQNNRDRARGFIGEAVDRIDQASEREQMWVNSLNDYLDEDESRDTRRRGYTRALEEIIHEYPDEVEAKAFLALHLWDDAPEDGINSHEAVHSLLEQVFLANPMHPAHHYRIHLWDYENAERALHSAAMGGPSAPGIAHMWHMPGHIYSQLKRYHDACYQQEASARTDHAHMMRDRVMPDEIFNFAHNNEWFIRNMINVGRVHDGIDLAKNMIELPRHPRYNSLDSRGSARYGRTRLFDVLREYEMWDELIALADTVYLEPTDLIAEQIKRERFLAVAHYRKGDLEAGDTCLANLRLWQVFDAHRSIDDAVEDAAGYQALAQGRAADAVDLFDDVRRFDRCEMALAEYAAGNADDAIETAERAVENGEREVRPLATLAYLQFEAGQQESALETFDELRAISQDVDLDSPVFARLEGLALSCDAGEDWRQPLKDPGDLGDRPALDSLGPFRWAPSPAIDWTLPTGTGESISLNDYRGKPVIVIFYLGYGCLHCVEQIEKFVPMTQQFKDAGIQLVAISSDPVDALAESITAFETDMPEGEHFPFPLVSDFDLDVFKDYRAYDDFEKMELHGTFLIDANGLVRWNDVSYEPFMEAEFLLKEAQRLLAQPQWKDGGKE